MFWTDVLPYALTAGLSAVLGAAFGLALPLMLRTGAGPECKARGQRLHFALRQREPRSFWPPVPPHS